MAYWCICKFVQYHKYQTVKKKSEALRWGQILNIYFMSFFSYLNANLNVKSRLKIEHTHTHLSLTNIHIPGRKLVSNVIGHPNFYGDVVSRAGK